jgi:hypothetical protein
VKILTVNEKSKVSHPYASRDGSDQRVSVPNGDAGSAHERMLMPRGEMVALPETKRTYMRSTIKRDAAEKARYPKI